MGLLSRFGLHRNICESPEFAAHRCTRLRPESLHNLQPFNKTLATAFTRDTEDRLGYVWPRAPDADDDPAVTQLIERCQAFSQLNRVSYHRDQHRCSQVKLWSE